MQIYLIDHLLQTSLVLCYKGNSIKIDNLVIDTGAAHTLLSSDVVSQIGIKFESGDKLVRRLNNIQIRIRGNQILIKPI